MLVTRSFPSPFGIPLLRAMLELNQLTKDLQGNPTNQPHVLWRQVFALDVGFDAHINKTIIQYIQPPSNGRRIWTSKTHDISERRANDRPVKKIEASVSSGKFNCSENPNYQPLSSAPWNWTRTSTGKNSVQPLHQGRINYMVNYHICKMVSGRNDSFCRRTFYRASKNNRLRKLYIRIGTYMLPVRSQKARARRGKGLKKWKIFGSWLISYIYRYTPSFHKLFYIFFAYEWVPFSSISPPTISHIINKLPPIS